VNDIANVPVTVTSRVTHLPFSRGISVRTRVTAFRRILTDRTFFDGTFHDLLFPVPARARLSSCGAEMTGQNAMCHLLEMCVGRKTPARLGLFTANTNTQNQ